MGTDFAASDSTGKAYADERAAIARWVATWRRAGRELEELRRARLSQMSVAEMQRSIQAIFSGDTPPPPLRASSGLVEMQRLLARLR